MKKINGTKKVKILIPVAIVMVVVTMITSFNFVKAGAPNGIEGNGTGGIYIDINATPYTNYAQIKPWGANAYSNTGCAWFASARVNQLTGVNCTIWSGKSWYNSAYSQHGFTRGRELRGRALACYENHVAVVESVSGTTAVVSEGGTGKAANGYCIIHTMSKSTLESNRSGNFLGYVYLTGSTPPAHDPIGYVDIVEGVSGGVKIKGWALDEDNPSVNLDIHVYIGGEAGSSTAVGYSIKADKYRSDVGYGNYHGFEETIYTNKYGRQSIYVYAINIGGGSNVCLKASSNTVDIKKPDSEAPTLVEYDVTNLNDQGYTITCTWQDNVGVTNVEFPTWEADAQSGGGAIWYKGTSTEVGKTESTWEFTFSKGVAGKKYFTHIYASDAAGNRTCFPLTRTTPVASPIEVKNDTRPPVFENVLVRQDKEGEVTLSIQLSDDTGLGKLSRPGGRYLWFSADKNSSSILDYYTGIKGNIACWDNQRGSQPIMDKQFTGEVTESVQCDSIVGYGIMARDLSGNYAVGNSLSNNENNYYQIRSGYIKGQKNKSIEISLNQGEEITLETIRQKLSQNNNLEGADVYFDAKNERILKKSNHSGKNMISNQEEEKKVVLTANTSGTEYVYFLNVLTGGLCSCKIQVKGAMPGDVYEDGKIDGKDVSLLLQYRLNKCDLTEEQIAAGDVYQDGKIDGKDVSKLLQYRLGKISSLE